MSEVGGPKLGLMNIGEEAKPPFAVLPDPSSLFLNSREAVRSARRRASSCSPISRFLARCRAGPARYPGGPAAGRPCRTFDRIGQALEHGMPPLSRALFEPDDVAWLTVERLLRSSHPPSCRQATAAAVARRARGPADERARDGRGGAEGRRSRRTTSPSACWSLAGLQVHFARLAALLAPTT